jgi:hypothetical protein
MSLLTVDSAPASPRTSARPQDPARLTRRTRLRSVSHKKDFSPLVAVLRRLHPMAAILRGAFRGQPCSRRAKKNVDAIASPASRSLFPSPTTVHGTSKPSANRPAGSAFLAAGQCRWPVRTCHVAGGDYVTRVAGFHVWGSRLPSGRGVAEAGRSHTLSACLATREAVRFATRETVASSSFMPASNARNGLTGYEDLSPTRSYERTRMRAPRFFRFGAGARHAGIL